MRCPFQKVQEEQKLSLGHFKDERLISVITFGVSFLIFEHLKTFSAKHQTPAAAE